jgi:hypothetical protein
MRADIHSISLRQTDRRLHRLRVTRVESTSNIRRRNVRHDVFIIANVLTHVTVEVDFHITIHVLMVE